MRSILLRLGLIITYRCNAECRHCFFESGPHREEIMSLELGFKAIDEAAGLGAEWISFTGGEPFLERESLMSLIEYASDKGLNTEAVSNGFWAETSDKAEYILNSLKELGLDVLNLSIDDFHQEYVLINHVRNAYWAAVKLGIKIVIMNTTTKNNKITTKTIPGIMQDDKIQLLGGSQIRYPNAMLIETPISPVGRGATIREYNYSFITEIKCSEALRDIGIGPDGDVYPCCGPLSSKINLGNIKDCRLEKILEHANEEAFFDLIRKGAPISGAYYSKCHACLSLAE